MYVDDTDLLVTGTEHDNHTTIQRKSQKLAPKWRRTLSITGGALQPEKCWWHLITFKCNPDGSWRYKSNKESQAELFLADHNIIEQKIDRQEPTKGSMGLGVHLAPDGNNKDQIKYMTGKVLKWTKNIKAAFLSQFAAVLDIKTTIWATLRYLLAALTMTEAQCDKLVQPIYS